MEFTGVQLIVQGLRLLSTGLNAVADDIEEGASLPLAKVTAKTKKAAKSKEVTEEEVVEVIEDYPENPMKAARPKDVEDDTTSKEAPENELESLPDDLPAACTELVLKHCADKRKSEVLAALKTVGATKVTTCPEDKLPVLYKALKAMEG